MLFLNKAFSILNAVSQFYFIMVDAIPVIGDNVKDAENQEFPFAVSIGLKVNKPHFCTGALITRKHVLTAAHCLLGRIPEQVRVSIGSANYELGKKYNVQSWITYDEWAWEYCIELEFQDNDIGIIQLETPVLDTKIKPAILSRVDNKELYGKQAVVMGWGYTNNGVAPKILQKADVDVLQNEICSERISFLVDMTYNLHERFLCSSARPSILLGCGDSGGPFVDKNNILMGINKGTCPDAKWINVPDYIAKKITVNGHIGVYYYRDFIKSIAGV